MENATKTRWSIVALVTIASVAAMFQIGKIPASLPAMRADLGLGLVMAGWVVAMVSIIGALAGVAMGAISQRLGQGRVVLFGLLGIAAASFCGVFAETGAMILITRFVESVGLILIYTTAPALVLRVTRPEHQRPALAIWGMSIPTGIAIMLLVTPALLTPFGWRGVWIANAAILVAAAAAFALGTGSLRQLPTSSLKGGAGGLLRDIGATMASPGSVLIALCFTAFSVNFYSVAAFLPTFLIEQNGLGSYRAAELTSIAVFLSAVSCLLGGAILNRGVERYSVCAIASALMGITGLCFFALDLSFNARFAFLLCFFFIAGFLPPAIFSSAPVHASTPHRIATTNGLFVQGSSLGQLVGPPALAAVVTTWSWEAAPWMIAIVACLGVILAVSFRATEVRRMRHMAPVTSSPAALPQFSHRSN